MNTQCMTAYLFSLLISSAKSSKTAKLISAFFTYLKSEFLSSLVFRTLSGFVSFVKSTYDASFLKKYISRDGFIQSQYENSFLCFALSGLYKALSAVAGGLLKFVLKIFAGSYTAEVFSRCSKKQIFSFSSCLAIFISLMIICPHEVWNNLYGVLAAFVFLAYFMAKTFNQKQTVSFKTESFGLVVFVLFAAFSVTYAYDKADALRIVLFLMAAVIFGFLLSYSLKNRENLVTVLKVISLGAFLTSVIGIIQRFIGVEVNPEYVDIATNSSMPGRVFSTFANPNNFAELLVLTIPVTAALVFILKSPKEKLLYLVCLLTDFIAIGMSYSRSCWVALFIAAVVMILIYDWRFLVPCAIIAMMAVPFLPESITDRILTIGSMKDTSNASRLLIWRGAWKMIQNYFVSGVGAGPVTFSKYYLPLADHWALTAPHSHMVYMELIIEFGIFAFIGFMMHMIFVFKNSLRAISKADKDVKAVIAAIVGSMCGMAFVFAVEYVWFYPRVMFMFWIMLGILLAAARITRQER